MTVDSWPRLFVSAVRAVAGSWRGMAGAGAGTGTRGEPPLLGLFRQALVTFSRGGAENSYFSAELDKLRRLMDRLRAEDVGLDPGFSDPALWGERDKPPCTYIEVFQNSDINMSIFILKPGFKMPLHDHPHMHGLLKVISGAVNITSYTEYPLKEENAPSDYQAQARQEAARLQQGVHKRRKFFAKVTSSQTCQANAETCVLTPTNSNYHEIEALGFPAAFFDILAPPYDSLIEKIGPRRCRYYRIVNEVGTNMVEMQEIDVPDSFYCDTAPYLGPLLS